MWNIATRNWTDCNGSQVIAIGAVIVLIGAKFELLGYKVAYSMDYDSIHPDTFRISSAVG